MVSNTANNLCSGRTTWLFAFSLMKSLWGTKDKTLLPAEVCTLWTAVKQAHQLSGLWRWDQDWGWSTAWWAVKSHLSWSLYPSKHTGYASYLWLLILGRWLLLKALYFTRCSQLWFLKFPKQQSSLPIIYQSTVLKFSATLIPNLKLYPSKVMVPVIPTAESCTWPYRRLWSGLIMKEPDTKRQYMSREFPVWGWEEKSLGSLHHWVYICSVYIYFVRMKLLHFDWQVGLKNSN